MGYATLSQVKEFVRAGYGTCEDSSLVEVINSIRQEWYYWYAEISLFMDAVECFQVHRFCFDCNSCQDSYLGVTLPREVQQVEAMWHNDWPVTLRSGWREYQTGITPECDCRLQKFDVPGAFSTVRDIAFNCPVELIAVATHRDDVGKVLKIRGFNATGVPMSAEIVLSLEPVRTADAFKSIDGRGGIIKPVTTGRVILTDSKGCVYGRYEPDETVPTYRRIRITGLPGDCSAVNIRASRRFYPLFGDDDVVENDNRPAFDAMARYLRLNRRTDKDSASMAAERDFLGKAKAMLTGEKSRETGKGTSGNLRMQTAVFRGHRLNRFGGGRRF
jgi:hypothetical protein